MIKNKNLIGWLTVLTCIFFTSITSYAKIELEDCKDGVVRIMATDGTDWYLGSGFAIGVEGETVSYIVTNYHVIEDMTEVYLYRDDDNMFLLERTDIVYPINDIAVMELVEPLDELKPLILEIENHGKVGDNIYTMGFPAIADEIDATFSGYPEDITVTSGIISKITAQADNVKYYQIDATINQGNSGGPLINSDGYVIGINSFGLLDQNGNSIGYNGSVLLDKLITALDTNGYKYAKASEQTVEVISANTSEKQEDINVDADEPKKDKDQETAAKDKDDTSNNGLSVITFIIVIGAMGLILVILILIIILTMSKKKKMVKESLKPVSKPIQAPRQSKKPQVLGISGFQSGKVYDLIGSISFGRNPVNRVIYPADYKGISGNHCRVEFDQRNNLFILSDIGSSYGTFLAKGQRINANSRVALNSGERFYLADINEMFEVRLI